MIKIPNVQDLGVLVGRLLDKGNIVKCPSLRVDDTGPYCSKSLNGNEQISERRRLICDQRTLSSYCLDGMRYQICIWNSGEKLD